MNGSNFLLLAATNFCIHFLSAQNCDFSGPSSQGASWSPDGEQIVYGSNIEGNWEIYVMSLKSMKSLRITYSATEDYFPYFSPDGSVLVYVGFDSTYSKAAIYIYDFTTGKHRAITDPNRFNSDPHWSPDGKRIALHAKNKEGNEDIYVINADGSHRIQLTNDEAKDYNPKWSPDGKKLIFVKEYEGEDSEIFMMDADGKNAQNITNDDVNNFMPSLSIDLQSLVFGIRGFASASEWSSKKDSLINAMEIQLLNLEDPKKRTFITSNDSFESGPNWSPDGKHLVFTTCRDGQREIYLASADGTEVRRLTRSR